MNTDELRQEYEAVRPLADRFCEALKEQLEELLSGQSVPLGVPIESRVKAWTSIAEKLERTSLELNSVKGFSDLIGLRVIVLFNRGLTKVCELLSETFVVESQEDTGERLSETQFGYRSFHYVVKLPEQWLSVPSFKDCGDLRAEVQIRTLAQHIWAAASHELQYKQEAGVPPPVRRSIHRVSALLETVDLEFERVLDERDSYLSQVKPDQSDEPLNVDLLARILDSKLPADNKGSRDPEFYSDLLSDLGHFGIETSGELVQLIQDYLGRALEADAASVEKNRRFGVRVDQERLHRGVFFAHVGLVREMMYAKLGEEWVSYLKSK